ncbi:unnamed protein product [Ascophyllum nodosum]
MPVLTVPRWFLDSLLEHSGKDEPACRQRKKTLDVSESMARKTAHRLIAHACFCQCQSKKEESALLIAAGSAFDSAFYAQKHIDTITGNSTFPTRSSSPTSSHRPVPPAGCNVIASGVE